MGVCLLLCEAKDNLWAKDERRTHFRQLEQKRALRTALGEALISITTTNITAQQTYLILNRELSIRAPVMEGQRKRFDLATQAAVSLAIEHLKPELGNFYERQPWI